MNETENIEEAIEALQQLGLKEYEARCFVGLSRLEMGTAKKLSEVTEVPRTRVYDAIRVLEAQGLVEIQHSSPQRFRTVSLDEATDTLRDQYEDRVERLHNALDAVRLAETDGDELGQEVWAISGRDAIENRTEELIETATEEIVLVLGDEWLLTEGLVATLNEVGAGVELLIGAVNEPLEDQLRDIVPTATAFISGLDWLHGDAHADNAAIGRLLLVDRSTILVSSILPNLKAEQAIFGTGLGNGLVVIARRLLAQRMITMRNPVL